jgi:hypothetical protein
VTVLYVKYNMQLIRDLLILFGMLERYLLTYFTYSLTPSCRTLFEKLIVIQPVKKYAAFFREPEGSLLCSQKLAIGPYPEPTESRSPHQTLSPKVQLNVILPPPSGSSQWSLTFGLPNQNYVNTSPLPHAYHMPHPCQPP